MTDHPRFEPLEGSPETMHFRYHGGALVASVLRLADRWAASPRWSGSPGKPARAVDRARFRVLLTALIMLGVVLLTALWAPGRQAGNRPSPPPPHKVALAPA